MGYTHYYAYNPEGVRMTVEQLNETVLVINAFLRVMFPEVILLTSDEDVSDFYANLSKMFKMHLGGPFLGCMSSGCTLEKLRQIMDVADSMLKKQCEVVYVQHNKKTGIVRYYTGHPDGKTSAGYEYDYHYMFEININDVGSNIMKTRRDSRSDKYIAAIYGIAAAMFPESLNIVMIRDYSEILETIAKTVPTFVSDWKEKNKKKVDVKVDVKVDEDDKVEVEDDDVKVEDDDVKVGGKVKRTKNNDSGSSSRRSDRLRLR
jgi:hypothetical protein